MNEHEKLNYLEFAASNMKASKAFFAAAFSWEFEDYGPDYTAFSNAGLDGGFYRADLVSRADQGGALLVFYSNDIDSTQARVEKAGGQISQAIFEFPGGRRFHFIEPSGNEFAVWTDIPA